MARKAKANDDADIDKSARKKSARRAAKSAAGREKSSERPDGRTAAVPTPVASPSLSQSDAAAVELAARRAIIETARAMSATGLSPGRSGNVSCRWGAGMLITPSGMAYDLLTPSDIVFVGAGGEVPAKSRKPSSEWRFHLAAYVARPDRGAVVHTHSLHATVLACAHQKIPAFHYMVAVAGGTDIPLVPYATFGTEELSKHVAKGLAKRDACLMANHGQIAIGKTLSQALELAAEVEVLAEQYVKVLSLGKPKLLGKSEMAEVLARFATYGQKAQDAETAELD
ncbi:MAG: class II aldolase/adducin family protein [Hyphomicrobiaceae bacterium]|nr:class II aldolase/adducin family protein [Hyphomicrobiaceae bacterium]